MTDIAPDLLAILACPCPAHARLDVAGESLVCTSCSTRFEVRNGIPVLLLDEATPGPEGIGTPVGGDHGDGR